MDVTSDADADSGSVFIKEEDVEVTISEAESIMERKVDLQTSKDGKTKTSDFMEDLTPETWCHVQEFAVFKTEIFRKSDGTSSEADSLDHQITSEESFCQGEVDHLGHFLDRSDRDDDSCAMESETEKQYSCNICEKQFTYLSQYKMHSVIHSGKKPFICTVCNKSFTQYGNLKTHYGVHTGERPHSCPVCDRKFRKLGNLKKHHQIHSSDRLFSCSECEEKFQILSHLKKHERIHSGEPMQDVEKQHECHICNKKFTQPNDLRRHILIHTGERPFVCRECGKGFIRCSALREHSRVHTGEKPYTCGVCRRQFSNLNNLNLHLRSHSNVCEVCGKRFVTPEKLERHSHIHVGGKLCTRKGRKKTTIANYFNEKEALARAGDKPYVCTVCEKRFSSASNLNHHCHIHLQDREDFGQHYLPLSVSVDRLNNKILIHGDSQGEH